MATLIFIAHLNEKTLFLLPELLVCHKSLGSWASYNVHLISKKIHFTLCLLRKHVSQQTYFFGAVDFCLFRSFGNADVQEIFPLDSWEKIWRPRKANPDSAEVKKENLKQQKGVAING
jgi:hypothetical protein